MDAWQLSEDELTKEYCILTDDSKAPRRSTTQNLSRIHKNPQQIAVVHKASSTSSNNSTNVPITATNDANHHDLHNNDHMNDNKKPSKALTPPIEHHESASKAANNKNTAIEYG